MSASLSIDERAGARHLTLGAMQGQSAAPALRAALLDALGAGRPVVIEASGVHMIGTGALQVLLAARASFAAARLGLRLDQPSHAVVQALAAIGFAPATLTVAPTVAGP